MEMNKPIFPALVAFIGYSVKIVSQAAKKIGLGFLKTNKVRCWTIWSTATVWTGSSALIILYAVSLVNVSAVGAMAVLVVAQKRKFWP